MIRLRGEGPYIELSGIWSVRRKQALWYDQYERRCAKTYAKPDQYRRCQVCREETYGAWTLKQDDEESAIGTREMTYSWRYVEDQ